MLLRKVKHTNTVDLMPQPIIASTLYAVISKVFIAKFYYFILFIMQGPHAITSWNAFWMLNTGLHFIYVHVSHDEILLLY